MISTIFANNSPARMGITIKAKLRTVIVCLGLRTYKKPDTKRAEPTQRALIRSLLMIL